MYITYIGNVYSHLHIQFTVISGEKKKNCGVYEHQKHTHYSQPTKKTRLKNQELYREVGLSEFESESLAPKAKRMDQATPQAPTYTV
jgi:hypothetical protein